VTKRPPVEDGLQNHVVRYLGPISASWQRAVGGKTQVRLLRFDDRPARNLTTLATLGLSQMELGFHDGRQFRQELLMACGDCAEGEMIRPLLTYVADELMSKGRALARGDVLGPHGPLVPGSTLTALYAAVPMFYAEGFRQWDGSSPPTIFVQLIPITSREADVRRNTTPSEFERFLEQAEPDVFDLYRPSKLLDTS
jgi:hypothetical protein